MYCEESRTYLNIIAILLISKYFIGAYNLYIEQLLIENYRIFCFNTKNIYKLKINVNDIILFFFLILLESTFN